MTSPANADASLQPPLEVEEVAEAQALLDRIPGYSDLRHYAFFRVAMRLRPIRRVLLLGVYFGRDAALLLQAAHRAGRILSVTGVDKFSNDACADWPDEFRDATWEAAGFGPAPTMEAAAANLGPLAAPSHVALVRAPDDVFMQRCRDQFDLIYLDTAHDEATVRRQLAQARPLLAPGGLVAGDDYQDRGSWGVASALRKSAPGHRLLYDYIWVATEENLQAGDARALAA